MRREIGSILVGTSLEPVSDGVVRVAHALATAAGAELHLVHAFALPLADEPTAGDGAPGEMLRGESDALHARLGDQLRRLGIGRPEIASSRIETGAPHRALVDVAQRVGADLLVVGASEEGGAIRRMIGSTADRVVRKATCPVLVARGPLAPPLSRVLLPVDLSVLSADTFGASLEILDALGAGEECEATVLLVLSDLLQKTFSFRFRVPMDEVGELAAAELDEFVDRHGGGRGGDRRPRLAPKLRAAEVTEGILEEIEEEEPDLVLMGTHGRGGFERFLIGSVASGVVRRAPCGVVVVPPEAALRAALAREQPREEGIDDEAPDDEGPSAAVPLRRRGRRGRRDVR